MRQHPQINLRIPEDLKTRLATAATASRRSVTAEILIRLERSLDGDEDGDEARCDRRNGKRTVR